MKINAWKIRQLPVYAKELPARKKFKTGKELFKNSTTIGWHPSEVGLVYVGNSEYDDRQDLKKVEFASLNLHLQLSVIHSRLKAHFNTCGFEYSKKSDLFYLPFSSKQDAVVKGASSGIYVNIGFKYSIEHVSNRHLLLINPYQVITKDGEKYSPSYSYQVNGKLLSDRSIAPSYARLVESYKYITNALAPDGIMIIDCGDCGEIQIVGSGELTYSIITEPSAFFGPGKYNQWPKLGLSRFGPLDNNIGKSTAPDQVRVLFIGSRNSFDLLRELKQGTKKEKYPFKGFDSIYKAELQMGVERFVQLKSEEIADANSIEKIIDLLVSKIVQYKNKDFEIDIVLIEMPKEWEEFYQGQDVDLHDSLKVKAYNYGVNTQLFKEHDYHNSENDDLLSNLSLGIYYKAGGEPWRIETDFDSTCYIGISFGYSIKDKKRIIGVAEIFDTHGQFVSIRSVTVKERELDEHLDNKRDIHLQPGQLYELLNNLLQDYFHFMDGEFPEDVVIHKTTYFNRAEQEDVERLSTIPTTVTLVYAQSSSNWHIIDKKEPPRGFKMRLSNRKALLYTSGVMERQKSYNLPGTPRPYLIEIQGDGNFTIEEICEQFMELSKLNFNSTNSYSRHPITLLHSKKLVNLLRAGLRPENIPTDPRSYI